MASKIPRNKPVQSRGPVKSNKVRPDGIHLAMASKAAAAEKQHATFAHYAVICQPNSTFYFGRKQSVPYVAASKLAQHLESIWGNMMPPLLAANFSRVDAGKKYNAGSAQEIYDAVVSIWQRALPGNSDPADTSRLTYIHNIIGGLFMTGKIDGNQVTLLSEELETNDRKGARVAFNNRAAEYGVPVAMYISGMKLPVEGIGNFEGFCFKAALKP